MSGEQKSARERYTLVAAMINMIIAGVWNIYVAEGISKSMAYTTHKNKDIRDSRQLLF